MYMYIAVIHMYSNMMITANRRRCLHKHISLICYEISIHLVSYNYIVTNSINSLLIGSRCIPIGTHTIHF